MPIYRDTILCEIIRPELNNKLSLFGLFGESIFLSEVPAVLPFLAVVQRWAPTANEPAGSRLAMAFELRGPGLTAIRFALTEVTVPEPPRPLIQAALQLQGLSIVETGDYELLTFIDGVERNSFMFSIAVPTAPQRQTLRAF
jgi:hypothetical protein